MQKSEAIEELTKLLIMQDVKDKEQGYDDKIVITKKELIKHSIRLIKKIKKS
jgi:hypothetical protein